MQYRIFHADIKTTAKESRVVGIEVQPPLGSEVGENITEVLCTENAAGSLVVQDDYLAESAYMTRNDESGTAFIIHAETTGTSGFSKDIALAIGTMINPCGIHDVTFEPPLQRTPHVRLSPVVPINSI
jgi:hypothetical protein